MPDAGLYMVATPIGNLGDISLRALHILSSATLVACEDTRVTGGLLHRYGIKKPLLSCHDHNEAERVQEIVTRIERGEVVVYVSDAGTPLVSDPGFRLVQACHDRGLMVTAVPGASAVLTALCMAGLPTDRFLFAGFLPPKSGARQSALALLTEVPATLVFYETGPRLAAMLQDMKNVYAGRRFTAVVARELTKMFEEVRRGTMEELATYYAAQEEVKGEIVVMVGPPVVVEFEDADIEALLRQALDEGMSVRDASAMVAKQTGVKKNEVYARALGLVEG